MQDKEPLRHPRVERSDDDYHLEDETSHLWAVSYADFLMVLLSFFILFFSVDKQDKSQIIQAILQQTQTGDGAGPSQGSGGPGTKAGHGAGGTGEGASPVIKSRDPSSKKSNLVTLNSIQPSFLDKFSKEYQAINKKLILKLPDNVYRKGAYQLGLDYKQVLLEALKMLKPYSANLKITFVGHTDSTPVTYSQNRVVIDNYDLSVLRATRALQVALKEGFTPDHLYAKGAAENARNSRSLSIEIEEIKYQ